MYLNNVLHVVVATGKEWDGSSVQGVMKRYSGSIRDKNKGRTMRTIPSL